MSNFNITNWEKSRAIVSFRDKVQSVIDSGNIILKESYVEWKESKGKKKGQFIIHCVCEME